MENLKKLSENKGLFLTIPEKEFARMIIDFLGAKEHFNKTESASFCIDLNDLMQFNYLLTQKTEKERFTNINIFSAKIRYSDSSERIVSTFDQLEKYHEQRNVFTNSVSLFWNIIVNFPNANNIETQKISLTVSKNKDKHKGEIVYSIEHTNQSWGFEVSNLFETQINKLAKKESKVLNLLYKYKLDIIKLTSYLMIILLIFNFFNINDNLKDERNEYIKKNHETFQREIKSIEKLKREYTDDIAFFVMSETYKLYENKFVTKYELEKVVNLLILNSSNDSSSRVKNFNAGITFKSEDKESYISLFELYFMPRKKHETLSLRDLLLKEKGKNKDPIYYLSRIKNNPFLTNKKIYDIISFIEDKNHDLNLKIDFLIKNEEKFTFKNNLSRFLHEEAILFAKLLLLLLALICSYEYLLFFLSERPFLLITKEDYDDRKRYLFKKHKGFFISLTAFIFSIVASVIASILYGTIW